MDAKSIGLTELARQVGTTKQNIERWANGERALKPEMAAKIAPILDVTAAQLLLLPDEAGPSDRSSTKSKDEKMGADALAALRAALIAYGVDKSQLATLLPVIDTFVKKAKPAQSEQTDSRGQSQPATPRRVKAP
ncbi:helix-turn-helix domain-containing protein [Ensifer sp. NPDC090286]|uniref:helix-turn-helix domain-containing protein n=1 Tax=Ensifer sp. NPDC090286 TaxID=3363991 RepID=UPI00383B5931